MARKLVSWEEAALSIFHELDRRNFNRQVLPAYALTIYRALDNKFHKCAKSRWPKLINEFIDREVAKPL